MNKGTINLESERLILRKIELSDYNDIFNCWTSDFNVSKYVTWNPHETPEETKKKIEAIVQRVYGGKDINVTPVAKKQIQALEELGFGKLPVCIAKTQYSFSDDPTKLGAPEGFTVTVKSAKIAAGAGFVVVLTGDIMTMPGLPKVPAAENIDVNEEGIISGLF